MEKNNQNNSTPSKWFFLYERRIIFIPEAKCIGKSFPFHSQTIFVPQIIMSAEGPKPSQSNSDSMCGNGM